MNLNQDRLKKLISYNPDTGDFIWNGIGKNRKAGREAGSIHRTGYNIICIEGNLIPAHRLAFLYMTGEIPEQVDHINRFKSDNRWVNLRPATVLINCKNMPLAKTNTSGFCGVGWHKINKKWRAYIKVERVNISLGCYFDKSKAIEARERANVEYGFHENHGKEVNK